VDDLKFMEIKNIQSYWSDKISDSVNASLTILATERAGTEDLVFRAANHIYGETGNYVKIAVVASGVDQALSSVLTGSGIVGDPYIYTLTTGTQASQSSNSAVRDFINLDPNAIGIIVCESNDDETADPAYVLAETALSGGLNAKIGVYQDVPYVVGDFITVCNFSNGSKEDVVITKISAGDSPYVKYLEIDRNLTETYISPEIGTSSSVGVNYLTDNTKSWVTDEHKNDKLIDSAADEFKISGNNDTTLTIIGTPASGVYRIVKDHVSVVYGRMDSGYIIMAKVYSRFTGITSAVNMDNFINYINDKGHQLVFVDIS